MNTCQQFKNLTNLYSKTKTVQMELKPVGKTRDNLDTIIEDGIRKKELDRVIKSLFDRYYRAFIDKCTWTLDLDVHSYVEVYRNGENTDEESRKLRKVIADHFKKEPIFASLFSAKILDVIKIDEYSLTKEDIDALGEFDGFSTYFTRFFNNRKLIFNDSDTSATIAGRLIKDNLPKFIDNCSVYESLRNMDINFGAIEEVFKDVLDGRVLDEVFSINSYSEFVTSDGIALFNTIIGGISIEDGTSKQGINELINLYNQKNKTRLPLMAKLYQMLLSENKTYSFVVPEKIADDVQLKDLLRDTVTTLNPVISERGSLTELMADIKSYDTSHIYIDSKDINSICYDAFGDWTILSKAVEREFEKKHPKKPLVKDEQYYEAVRKYQSKEKVYSLDRINSLIGAYIEGEVHIEKYISSPYKRKKGQEGNRINAVPFCREYDEAVAACNSLLNRKSVPGDRSLLKTKTDNIKFKAMLNAANDYAYLVKRLLAVRMAVKDEAFYSYLETEFDKIRIINQVFNKVSAYLTQKPYELNNIPLTFGYSEFLGGWSSSVETAKGGIILRRNDPDKPSMKCYYIGIFKKGSKLARTSFTCDESCSDDDAYEKMYLSYLGDPSKYIPKNLIGASSFEKEYGPVPEEIKRIAKNKTHKIKSSEYKREDLDKLIDYSKHALSIYEPTKRYVFTFRNTEDYTTWEDFCADVSRQGYICEFHNIPAKAVDEAVEDGNLYLFRLWHRKMKPGANDRLDEQLSLLYSCFSDENRKEGYICKLSANAGISYRPASLRVEDTAVHKAGVPIKRKIPSDGSTVSLRDTDIIKDKNKSREMFVINIPIEINRGAPAFVPLNKLVNERIKNSEQFPNIVAVKRGHENLLYMTVLDSNTGHIIEERSLNMLGGSIKQDYLKLFNERKNRIENERRDWASVSSLKELKKSYVAEAVGEVTNAMADYNAMAVLEDLNACNAKAGILEDNIYKTFALALINKLEYKTIKDQRSGLGSVLHALQLSKAPSNQMYLGKQSGVVLFASPAYTSNADPVTGFINFANFMYKNETDAKNQIEKIDGMRFNKAEGVFEITIDFRKFTDKKIGNKTIWTVTTHGTRSRSLQIRESNKRVFSDVDITNDLGGLLASKKIDLSSDNLITDILEIDDPRFFKQMVFLIKLTFQTNNIYEGGSYYTSPVRDDQGRYFDTRTYRKDLPTCTDGIGSYNLARKGVMVLDRIRKISDGESLDLLITVPDWCDRIQT